MIDDPLSIRVTVALNQLLLLHEWLRSDFNTCKFRTRIKGWLIKFNKDTYTIFNPPFLIIIIITTTTNT